MFERNREIKSVSVKGLSHNSTIEHLAESLKVEAIKENPTYEYGDLYIVFENGYEINAANIKDKTLDEIGITRFSRLSFCFKMVEMVFRVLDDTSLHYISLDGAERLSKKDFINHLKTKYSELPAYFSIINDGV